MTETTRVDVSRNEDGQKCLNSYAVLNTLGSGSYGKVKRCIDTNTKTVVAIKIINKSVLKKKGKMSKNSPWDSVLQEIAIQKKLDHPNVVKLFEVMDDPSMEKMYIVFELAEKGILFDPAKDKPKSEEEAAKIFAQMCCGLQYLHACGIIHRDIKPENILVAEDGVVKFSDFGVAQIYNVNEEESGGDGSTVKTKLVRTSAGTPAFWAPETINTAQMDKGGFLLEPVDVWAMGITLFNILTGSLPFYSPNQLELTEMIRNNPLVIPDHLSENCKDLLAKILEKDPAKRYQLKDIVGHAWMVTVGGSKPTSSSSSSSSSTTTTTTTATVPPSFSETDVEKAIMNVADKVVLMVKIIQKLRVLSNNAKERIKERNSIHEASVQGLSALLQPLNLSDGGSGSGGLRSPSGSNSNSTAGTPRPPAATLTKEERILKELENSNNFIAFGGLPTKYLLQVANFEGDDKI